MKSKEYEIIGIVYSIDSRITEETIILTSSNYSITTLDKPFSYFEIIKTFENRKIADASFYHSRNLKSFRCLIGKNGTGKTSILSDIANYDKQEYVYIILGDLNGEELYLLKGEQNGHCSFLFNGSELSIIPTDEIDFQFKNLLFFSNSLETHHSPNNKKIINISTSSMLEYSMKTEVNREDMMNQLKFLRNSEILSILQTFKRTDSKSTNLFTLENKQVKLELSNMAIRIAKYDDIFGNKRSIFNRDWISQIFDLGDEEVSYLEKSKTIHNNPYKITILYALTFIIKEKMWPEFRKRLEKISKQKPENKTDNNLLDTMIFSEFKKNNMDLFEDDTVIKIEDIRFLFSHYSVYYNTKNNYPLKDSDTNKIDYDLAKMIDFISQKSPLSELVNLKWQSISSGEYNLYNMFSRINNMIIKNEKDGHYILLMDEIDLGLHPEWQIYWVEIFSKILNTYRSSFQVIFTTHSPLILSDLRSYNVTRLKKYKYLDCSQNKTFAANIQTIISDDFITKQTIGSYSEKIISEIIDSLRSSKDQTSFSSETQFSLSESLLIVEEIGDPLYRNALYQSIIRTVKTEEDLMTLINNLSDDQHAKLTNFLNNKDKK